MLTPDAAQRLAPFALSIFQGKEVSFSDTEVSPFKVYAKDTAEPIYDGWNGGFIPVEKMVFPANSAFVIHVDGVIMRNDFCGALGSMTIADYIQQADADERIDSIIMRIDSGGGMVDGTREVWQALQNATTKTIAYVDNGMAASAAYYYASGADEIYLSQPTDSVGSIGVLVTMADFTEFYKKEGVKVEDIYSTYSTNKREEYEEWRKGNNGPIQKMLDTIASQFFADVKTGRGDKLADNAEIFTGKMYYADEAIELGLADGVVTWAQLLEDLELKPAEDPNSSVNQNPTYMKQFEKLNAALGVSQLESVEGHVSLNEAQLEALNSALENADTAVANANAQVTEMESTVENAQAAEREAAEALANLCTMHEIEVDANATTAQRSEAVSAHIAELGKADGGKPAGVKPKGDLEGKETVAKEAQEFGFQQELNKMV